MQWLLLIIDIDVNVAFRSDINVEADHRFTQATW